MVRNLVLFGVLLPLNTVLAEEPTSDKTTSSDEIAKLMERIDQLEKRVKELENRPSINVFPQDKQNGVQSFTPQNNPFSPNKNFAPRLESPRPFSDNESIPKSWRPFQFNGMQYYIVPIRSELKNQNQTTRKGSEQE